MFTKLVEKLFERNKTKTIEVRNKNYKTLDELTEDDYWLIDAVFCLEV